MTNTDLLTAMQGMTPARAEGPPLITAAPVMAIMLGLLRGCDDADERRSTLSNLKRLIGQPAGAQNLCKQCTSHMRVVLPLLGANLAQVEALYQLLCVDSG